MRGMIVVVALVLVALLPGRDVPASPAPPGPPAADTSGRGLPGIYRIASRPASRVVISPVFQGLQLNVAIVGDTSFISTGYWDGAAYAGILADRNGSVPQVDSVGPAWLSFTRGRAGDLMVTRWWPPLGCDVRHEVWSRVADEVPDSIDAGGPGSREGALPRFGEYVYVEELPEAIEKVPPAYPEWAREKEIEGMVIVQALIGRDGRVKDTKVTHSIPDLDDYAVAAVKQWRFKPAQVKGRPVAVWVAIPVKFTLQ